MSTLVSTSGILVACTTRVALHTCGLLLLLVAPLLIFWLRGLHLCNLQGPIIMQAGSLSVALYKLSSWSYLFTQYGYGDNQDGINGIRSYPLDNIDSGYFHWEYGRLYRQFDLMTGWSATVYSNADAYRIHSWNNNNLHMAELTGKPTGPPLRCFRH